jgi:hypothetical protein
LLRWKLLCAVRMLIMRGELINVKWERGNYQGKREL